MYSKCYSDILYCDRVFFRMQFQFLSLLCVCVCVCVCVPIFISINLSIYLSVHFGLLIYIIHACRYMWPYFVIFSVDIMNIISVYSFLAFVLVSHRQIKHLQGTPIPKSIKVVFFCPFIRRQKNPKQNKEKQDFVSKSNLIGVSREYFPRTFIS